MHACTVCTPVCACASTTFNDGGQIKQYNAQSDVITRPLCAVKVDLSCGGTDHNLKLSAREPCDDECRYSTDSRDFVHHSTVHVLCSWGMREVEHTEMAVRYCTNKSTFGADIRT